MILILRICPEEIFRKELTIIGCLINPYTYAQASVLAAQMGERYLTAEKLGIELFRIEDYKLALEKLKTGSIAKAMFDLGA